MIAPLNQVSVDPIISRLRPRTVLEILDQGFRLYRKHFLTFLAITAVVYVPVNLVVQLLSIYVTGTSNDLQTTTENLSSSEIEAGALNEVFIALIIALVALVVVGVLGSLLLHVSQGALTAAVSDSHMDQPVSFAGGYRAMLRRLGPLLGVMGLQLLAGLAILTPIALLFVVAVASFAGSGGGDAGAAGLLVLCFAFLLMIPAFAAYLYVYTRWAVVIPAVMVEKLGPAQALRRSWGLIGNYWWRTLGLQFVLGIMSAVVSAGPGYLIAGIVALFLGGLDSVTLSSIVSIVSVFTTLFFVPLQLVAMTLYYFDLRVRKEGFDLETALNQRYAPPPPQPGDYGGQPQYPPLAGTSAPPPMLGYEGQGAGFYGQGYNQPPQAYAPARIEPGPEGTQPIALGGDRQQVQSQETVNLGSLPPQSAVEQPEVGLRPPLDENRER